jgi:hypothetical protein
LIHQRQLRQSVRRIGKVAYHGCRRVLHCRRVLRCRPWLADRLVGSCRLVLNSGEIDAAFGFGSDRCHCAQLELRDPQAVTLGLR